MAYEVTAVDAKTRSGKYAQYVKYDDFTWPCPWQFSIDGKIYGYSIGGYINNHYLAGHDLDLVAPAADGILLSEAEQQFLVELLRTTNAPLGRDILDKIKEIK
jgi:hypothetical protein